MFLTSASFRPYDFLDSGFAFGRHDPDTHFAFAGNRNPHLAWGDVPPGTRSFVLICVDPDVPSRPDDVNQDGRVVPIDLPRVDFFHWVVADLPAELREIAAGSHASGVVPHGKPFGPTPDGGLTGLNDYTAWFAGNPDMSGLYAGYDGPAPPWNDARVHGYRFQLFALDVPTLGLAGPFTGPQVRAAMADHVLAQAELVALYAINPDAPQKR
jgi:Raf kinase inhibitor-like YbhB/YbcL family protein